MRACSENPTSFLWISRLEKGVNKVCANPFQFIQPNANAHKRGIGRISQLASRMGGLCNTYTYIHVYMYLSIRVCFLVYTFLFCNQQSVVDTWIIIVQVSTTIQTFFCFVERTESIHEEILMFCFDRKPHANNENIKTTGYVCQQNIRNLITFASYVICMCFDQI